MPCYCSTSLKEFCHFSPVDPGLVTFHHQAEQHRLVNQNIVTYNSECAHGGLSLWVGWLSVMAQGSGAMLFPGHASLTCKAVRFHQVQND